MKGGKNNYWWFLLFGIVFLLSQSHLVLDFAANPSFLGFPNWLLFMIGVHLLFSLLLYRFVEQTNQEDS